MTRFEDVTKNPEYLAEWLADLFFNSIVYSEDDEDGEDAYRIISNGGYEDPGYWLNRLTQEIPDGYHLYSSK